MAYRIVIRCPDTGRVVPTGIVVRDSSQFDGALLPRRILTCPHCGRQHMWTKADAWVESEGSGVRG